jgi:hypothetical protein
MGFWNKLFGKKKENAPKQFTPEEWDKHYEQKSAGLENVLGKSLDLVGHAIIPFEMGGAVDMYYYPNGIKGTGFATMELILPDGTGPTPNRMGTYELVAFTKLHYNDKMDGENSFSKIERRICGIFTGVGNFSFQAKLEPGETCELPSNKEPNLCLIFDEYNPEGKEFRIGENKHGLQLVMEVFREEMDYARANGSAELFKLLKEKGVYPYSDLDRKPVV